METYTLPEENLVHRVINSSKPTTVPTTNGHFHVRFICTLFNLILNCTDITGNHQKRKKVQKLQIERVLIPSKHYLQFILQREEFILNCTSPGQDLPTQISNLLNETVLLESALFEDGEIVETGREEWEVGWLVEKTDEESFAPRLEKIREDDEKMRRDEKERWKKRVSRQREAGHEDVMEGWLMRRDKHTLLEIDEYLESVTVEYGMNNALWDRWRYYGYWM
ncbi:hypothetical protein BLNAU_10801 [Blattamonas nauphoetae]|uniref:Uncharacterized protein n=1 Tax=Blattamonas nauphoetae TaxID=2049346 RepID=A0ABQ9XRS8_9EUKA|nr:hypothetical protein BLNAU_10801 [Blattamonas nauphoetae]